MSITLVFPVGFKPVLKHEEHDQSDHGNREGGISEGTGKGGNGLRHREIYELMVNRSDPQKTKLYDAEEKHQPQAQRKLGKPFPPNNRNEYATQADYDKAYKEYSKEFDEWSRETSRNLISQSAEKNLNGTTAGTQKYVNEITKSDWFVKEFGNGGFIGTPKVAVRDVQVAGSYRIGTKNGEGYSGLTISKGMSKNEPTIVHEISHYATAISASSPYDAHGAEFARNHIYVAKNVMGSDYASNLEKSYREGGVKLGD